MILNTETWCDEPKYDAGTVFDGHTEGGTHEVKRLRFFPLLTNTDGTSWSPLNLVYRVFIRIMLFYRVDGIFLSYHQGVF